MHRDGTLHRVLADGGETPMPAPGPLAPMTDEEVHAAALRDPDAQPLTPERFAGMRQVARSKTIRRVLGLTREEFSTKFHIPLGTLLDWEQGRAEPDQTARAYLRAIAGDAASVERALQAGPGAER
jgi:putative transcriptional regulator